MEKAGESGLMAGDDYWNAQGVGNRIFSFKASKVVPTGQDNKPYSIRALYLIAY